MIQGVVQQDGTDQNWLEVSHVQFPTFVRWENFHFFGCMKWSADYSPVTVTVRCLYIKREQ